ncbi:hypothetical protein BDV38DRAFT_241069 [Aspergillus pseudotamarii]|uniref:Uncharacterized protein n=1 Tax=Aspergillus pseudotamarii TaxID=132259 RepID=A0A5N6T0J4_ASPPS|nr:uncharacterized protein BDV38DRAFT_241069 [Aspergillus pseudotamarii]KAE8139700.1 hypothetical protein BDV38DRAFT_241069 [Aspergillus pseudotamarii]
MESLGDMMLHFCRSSLPLQGLQDDTPKQKSCGIMQKITTPTEVRWSGFPTEFATYINYSRSLHFDDKPDYTYLRKMLVTFAPPGPSDPTMSSTGPYPSVRNVTMIVEAAITSRHSSRLRRASPLLPAVPLPSLVQSRASSTRSWTATPLTTLRAPTVPRK